jgi:hypothetical protein
MKTLTMGLSLLLAWQAPTIVSAQAKYPPVAEYLMAPEAEVALARSAAPEHISARATVKVLTRSGYQIASKGDNGFVCLVMRGWTAALFAPEQERQHAYDAKFRAPICFDPVASKSVLPQQELRTKMAMDGRDPEAIAREISVAYATGTLPPLETVAFAYMWSADMTLGAVGAGAPHLMIYAPNYTNSLLGSRSREEAFANPFLPVVINDEGTPFAVIIQRLAANAAIRSKAVHAQSH